MYTPNLSSILIILFTYFCTTIHSYPIDNLRVENRILPITIDNQTPSFSWIIQEPNVQQLSFQVTVRYSINNTLVYDTGIVTSPSNTIVYNGTALQSDTDYTWTVNVQLASIPLNGTVWNYSNTSYFSTALFNSETDWKGNWIGGYNQIRKSFSVPFTIQRARIYVTAVGCYTLYVNGIEVSEGSYNRTEPASIANPGFSTIYTTRVLYNTYDITNLLVSNNNLNVLGFRIGSCKYGYLGEFCTGNETECNALLVQVNIQDNNNLFYTLSSNGNDNTWLGIASPILSNHFYNGEVFDNRNEIPNWTLATYIPSNAWHPVVNKISPTAQLSSHTMPQITSYETRIPFSVIPISNLPNSYLFDLGLNGAGKCLLSLPSSVASGITITITFAELIYPNNTAYIQFPCPASCCIDGGNCANQKYTFITNGSTANTESYELTFAYAGFRYIQVDNWPSTLAAPSVNALSCRITSSNVEVAGSVYFNSTNGWLLNGIQKAIVRTQRASLHSIPTDCPQREKRGWMADAHVSSSEASLNLFMVSVYENWLRTHADTLNIGCTAVLPSNWSCPKWESNQPGETNIDMFTGDTTTVQEYSATNSPSRGNCYLCCTARSGFGCNADMPHNATNGISDVIPFDKNGYGSYPGSICWTSALFVVADILYSRYNDVQYLNNLYVTLTSHLQYYTDAAADFNSTLVPYETYGDWNAISASNKLLMANAYYFHDALIVAKIALGLGNTDDAIIYLNLASTISEDIFNKYFNFTTLSWDTNKQQGAQSLALNMGLGGSAAEVYTQNISSTLVNGIINENMHLDVGTLGTRHILQALTLSGYSNIALNLANQSTSPSWGYFVTSPLAMGTLWESWDGGSGSYNHVMFGGGIGVWFYDFALGLRHQYRTVRIPVIEPKKVKQDCSSYLQYLPLALINYTIPLTEIEKCILNNIIHHTRTQLQNGVDKHEIFSISNLKQYIQEQKSLFSYKESEYITKQISTGRLLLDHYFVSTLQSMYGYIDTLQGRLSVEWSYTIPTLTIDITFPVGTSDNNIFIPRTLIEEIHNNSSTPLSLNIYRDNILLHQLSIEDILNKDNIRSSSNFPIHFTKVSREDTYEQHSISGSISSNSDNNKYTNWFALKITVPSSRYYITVNK